MSKSSERVGVSTGVDTKAIARGRCAPEALDLGLRENFHELEQA